MSALAEQQQRYRDARARLMGKPPRRTVSFAVPIDFLSKTFEGQAYFAWEFSDTMSVSNSYAEHIMREVGLKHGFKRADLVGRSRKPRVVNARREAMYRLRHELGLSMLKIARMFDRDHSTVVYNVNYYAERNVRRTMVNETYTAGV